LNRVRGACPVVANGTPIDVSAPVLASIVNPATAFAVGTVPATGT